MIAVFASGISHFQHEERKKYAGLMVFLVFHVDAAFGVCRRSQQSEEVSKHVHGESPRELSYGNHRNFERQYFLRAACIIIRPLRSSCCRPQRMFLCSSCPHFANKDKACSCVVVGGRFLLGGPSTTTLSENGLRVLTAPFLEKSTRAYADVGSPV